MVSLGDLDQYLKEQIPLIEKSKPVTEKMKEYMGAIESISKYEQANLGLIQAIKNPQTHNGSGVVQLYQNFENLLYNLDGLKSAIGRGYKIRVDGMKLDIDPNNTTKIWEYRLKWADKALGGLFFIYKDEAKQYIADTTESFGRAMSRYKL